MAQPRRLVETEELKTTYLSGLLSGGKIDTFFRYDEDLDTAFLLFVDPKRETVTHPTDDHVGLLYDPDNLEVVGLTFEDFERGFLPQLTDNVWKLSDTGLALEQGTDLAIRFEKAGWDRKALDIKSDVPNYREIDFPVPEYA